VPSDRETAEVPVDWRRSVWGLFLALIGASFVVAAVPIPLTSSAAWLVGGGLLIGLGMGLTDHVIEGEQRRLTTRLRDRFSNDDSRA